MEMPEPAAALVLFNPLTLPPLPLREQIEDYIYIKDKESKESEEASALTLGMYNAKQHYNIKGYLEHQFNSNHIISYQAHQNVPFTTSLQVPINASSQSLGTPRSQTSQVAVYPMPTSRSIQAPILPQAFA